jgi:hypothetical protein
MNSIFKDGLRYEVYFDGGTIGVVDCDEYVRNNGEPLYRIDGSEVYTAGSNAEYVAELNGLVAISVSDGSQLFRLEPDNA